MSAHTTPEQRTPRGSRFERLAAWSYRHRRKALGAWVAVLVGVTAASSAIGSDYHNEFSLPGTESQRAADTLATRAPAHNALPASRSYQIFPRGGGLALALLDAEVAFVDGFVARITDPDDGWGRQWAQFHDQPASSNDKENA